MELWDLAKNNMLDPFAFDKPKENILVPPKTMVRFCEGAPIIVTGDMGGETRIYRLHGIIEFYFILLLPYKSY